MEKQDISSVKTLRKELSRVPRSLSAIQNEDLFINTLDGGSIMIDILIYCSNQAMKDLFGNIRFSLDDFCNKMGHCKANLQRKLDKEQLKQLFGKEQPVYEAILPSNKNYIHRIESVFEAMLYKLTKENLVIPVKTSNGSTRYTGINIVNYFEIADNFETKKRTKRMYTISLSNEIQNLLYTNYSLIELNEYANIPDRRGYKRFYLILARMLYIIKCRIQEDQEASFTISIDQLAQYFDIKEEEARFKKMYVIRYLDRINKHLNDTKFKYTTIKGNGQKWAYTVKFEFNEESLRFFDEKYKAVFTQRFYRDLRNLYIESNLPEIGVHQYHIKINEIIDDPIEYKKMIDWIFSTDKQKDKEDIYNRTFYQTFGKTPQEMDVNIKDDFNANIKDIVLK